MLLEHRFSLIDHHHSPFFRTIVTSREHGYTQLVHVFETLLDIVSEDITGSLSTVRSTYFNGLGDRDVVVF